jgi:hypothetical protein
MTMNAPKKIALVLAAAAIALPQPVIGKTLSKAWNGTWHLNTEKSKFSSPDTTIKSETRSYTINGNRLTMKSNSTDGAGKTLKWSYSAVPNGKWYAMVGNPNADHIALTLVSDSEVKSQARLHGKPSAKSTASVSADGKELTIHRSILTLKSGPSDDVLVFDRAK